MPRDPSLVRYLPAKDEPLGVAVIMALSKAKGRDMSEVGPVLSSSINTDALDTIFRVEGECEPITVEFTVHDAIVRIRGGGHPTLEVWDLANEPTYG